jgi:ABC-type multidrug transport system permease subunit
MKILVLPLIITFLPSIILFLRLKYWAKTKKISIVTKIVLSVLFIAISLLTTFYAVLVSIEGLAENQVQCMTGAIVFIPLGLVNVVCVPLLLFSNRSAICN